MNQGQTDLISVIIPVYKVEKYLDKCVQSVVDQTYRNLEIILVDDGSPDRCGEMCDAWAQKDSRIKVIHKIISLFHISDHISYRVHRALQVSIPFRTFLRASIYPM